MQTGWRTSKRRHRASKTGRASQDQKNSNSNWLELISPCLRPVGPGERATSHASHSLAHPNWIEPHRVIYDHELVLFAKGRFIVEIEDRRYPCPAGTFIIVPPGKRHASWEAAGQSGYRYWSHFDWVYQGPYALSLIMTFEPAAPRRDNLRPAPDFIPRRIFHGSILSPSRAYDLAERLAALQVNGIEHDRFLSRALLLELLLELLDTKPRYLDKPSRDADLPHRVRALLESHLEQHSSLRIQDLMEAKLGYSYGHLCRLFHAKYGIPPLKYLNTLCVNRAKLLLRDTDLTVNDIAVRIGFRDPLYFSQLFRKLTGMPPTRYRTSSPLPDSEAIQPVLPARRSPDSR